MLEPGKVFGERLKRLLDEHDEKQVDLARLLNVTEATISRYLKGRIPDDVRTLLSIANHYGVTIDYLVGRTDDRNGVARATAVASADNVPVEVTLRNSMAKSTGGTGGGVNDSRKPHHQAGVDHDGYITVLGGSIAVHDTLAKRIAVLRQARGMSAADLAVSLQVDEPTVERWELGLSLPEPADLDALAAFFDVTVDWLLGRSPGPHETRPLNLPPGWQDVLLEAHGRGLDLEDVKRAIEFLADVQAKQKREG